MPAHAHPTGGFRVGAPLRQNRIHESTTHRRDQVQGKRKALALANEKSKIAGADKSEKRQDRGERWVEDFLAQRYPGENRAKTRIPMIGGWKQWREFLTDAGLRIPRALTYESVLAFMKWRSSQVKPSSGKVVSKNTALCDVRIMAVVMREAGRRGFADGNPCDRLGITKDPSKEKPEMTDAEIDKIRAALKARPQWMQVSFEIGIHQGCRLTETSVPWRRIDLANDSIMFVAKGRNGKPHEFTTKIHPGLKPLLQTLKTKNPASKTTYSLPGMAAKDWCFFSRRRFSTPLLSLHASYGGHADGPCRRAHPTSHGVCRPRQRSNPQRISTAKAS